MEELQFEKFYVKERSNEFSCNGGHTKAHIEVNYDIYPCVFAQSDNLKLGNLLKNDFFDIWFNQYHTLEFFTVLRNLNDSKCQECNLINICGGGCPGIAYEKHSSINYSDPRCC